MWEIQNAGEHISRTWDTSGRNVVMLKSLLNWISANFSQTSSTTWFSSFLHTTGSGTTHHQRDLQPEGTWNMMEIRSVMVFCNVSWRVVPNLVRIDALLNRRLQKYELAPFEKFDGCKLVALQTLQDTLLKPSVLAFPRLTRAYTLDTDACSHQACCFLLQPQPEARGKPIGYLSRSPKDAKHAYDTMHDEYLAVVLAVLLMRPYSKGAKSKPELIRTPALHIKPCRYIRRTCAMVSESIRVRFPWWEPSQHQTQPSEALLQPPTDREDKTYLSAALKVLKIVLADAGKEAEISWNSIT